MTIDLERKFLPPDDLPAFHKPFWDGLRDHCFQVQRCPQGHLRFIPTEICAKCGSEAWDWMPVSGRGEVYTFTVVHRAPTPAYQREAPYVIAHVTLAEGPRVIATLSGCAPESVHIGMPVVIGYDDVDQHWTLYHFEPQKDEQIE